jgi:hypothetical protein
LLAFGGGLIPVSDNLADVIVADGVLVNGREDIVVNDGPSTLLQRATAPGNFEPLRPLR